jgi:hypothetical protein
MARTDCDRETANLIANKVLELDKDAVEILKSSSNEGNIEEKKTFYLSGMSYVEGIWASCGWQIEAISFEDAARKLKQTEPLEFIL